MEFRVSSTEELPAVAGELLQAAGAERVFLFYGAMGAGKTTFIKALCSALGVTDPVASPTFSIVNEYASPHGSIYHFDFYRLKSETEAMDLGYEDYFYSGSYCFVEWPEKIDSLLPETALILKIEEAENGERVIFANKKY